jgi:hypothetical protein
MRSKHSKHQTSETGMVKEFPTINQKDRIYAQIFLKSLAVGEFYTASYTIIMHTLLHY